MIQFQMSSKGIMQKKNSTNKRIMMPAQSWTSTKEKQDGGSSSN
jgi:hypothetical protein